LYLIYAENSKTIITEWFDDLVSFDERKREIFIDRMVKKIFSLEGFSQNTAHPGQAIDLLEFIIDRIMHLDLISEVKIGNDIPNIFFELICKFNFNADSLSNLCAKLIKFNSPSIMQIGATILFMQNKDASETISTLRGSKIDHIQVFRNCVGSTIKYNRQIRQKGSADKIISTIELQIKLFGQNGYDVLIDEKSLSACCMDFDVFCHFFSAGIISNIISKDLREVFIFNDKTDEESIVKAQSTCKNLNRADVLVSAILSYLNGWASESILVNKISFKILEDSGEFRIWQDRINDDGEFRYFVKSVIL
jgi:hypothetical protein